MERNVDCILRVIFIFALKPMFSNGEKCGLYSMSYLYLCSKSMSSDGEKFGLSSMSYIFFALRSMFADGQTWAPREVGKFSLAHAGFVGRLQANITGF
jgi:hypothetical protein